jgi:hypothetical protein
MEPEVTTEQPAAPKRAPSRKRKTTKKAAAPFKAPAEFAGMTATECCNECGENKAKAEAAQRRLNEIDAMRPRQVSRDPRSASVMEGDAEWMARNPDMADEWRKLSAVVMGKCAITGAPGCAHPFKGTLSPALMHNPKATERYGRAKKALKHQMIDARG